MWEGANPGGSASYAIEHDGRFYLYYSRYRQEGERSTQQIGLATSPEVGQGMMESPCVLHANGRWFLFFTQHLGLHVAVSDTPFAFAYPRYVASTHASEIFPDGQGGWLISNIAKHVGRSHERGAACHTRWLSLARLALDGSDPVIRPLTPSLGQD